MRIAPRPLHRYPWYLRPVFWLQRRHYGQVLMPGLIWGRVPGLLLGVAFLFGRLSRRKARIPAELRALVCVRVSQLNHCPFCVDINAAGYLAAPGRQDKLDALPWWRESTLFSEAERAVLAYTDAVTDSAQRADEAHFVRLRRHFDDDALVELTALIAFQNMSSKFNAALGIPPQGFCSLPQDSPNADPGSTVGQDGGRHQGETR
ncbi:MAG: carboxymuconolactone decarboxylase family protein [Gammaproteobacteria bacterium]|nr:carboxymuconolactone decarboxylase family protein [Gammaproteobacteria bacterium]